MKLLAALLIALPVFAQLPVPKETDARLKPDGPQQWGLVQAKITNPGLPRVLLIGDSILEGYRVDVTSALRGKANVDYWKNPYHQSKELNDLLAKVLTYGPYDVIHFNMGLHGWTKGRILDGTYIPLTRAYVEILQRTLPRAKLIWASTTPVTVKDKPGELDPAINPIIVEHNRMAAEVMESLHVPVNDFYSLLINKLDLARGDQFHWKPAAYPILARAATASILQALGQTPAAALPDPSLSEELRARAGLPNFLDKLQAGGPVRIAYLGGSITAANGWRPKTIAWFQAQYPRAQIIEINAAISGTGSDYGAISAGQDVLSKDPDLIFLEHRVNGSAGFDTKSVEGLVRQIWKHNMRTDICLIYTISQPMLAGIQAGKQTPFGTAMEPASRAVT